jgi:hypothetical protein
MLRSTSKIASIRRTASAASGARELGQVEQLAPPVGPAAGVSDRAGFARFVVEFVEPGIGIRLQDAGISGQMLLRMFAAAIRRVVEYRRRRCRSGERLIVAHVRP